MPLDTVEPCYCTEWEVCDSCNRRDLVDYSYVAKVKRHPSVEEANRKLAKILDKQLLERILEDPSLLAKLVDYKSEPRIVKVAEEINNEQDSDNRSNTTVPVNTSTKMETP